MGTEGFFFRNARKDEAETIFMLYRSVIGRPFCAWDEEYPGWTEIRHDLETENLFVLEAWRRFLSRRVGYRLKPM